MNLCMVLLVDPSTQAMEAYSQKYPKTILRMKNHKL